MEIDRLQLTYQKKNFNAKNEERGTGEVYLLIKLRISLQGDSSFSNERLA
jgi:hypothetical protein